MSTSLDLGNYHFKRELGDITVIGTWIRIEESHRPCLVLIRTNDERGEHCQPCVITVDQAYIWCGIKGIGDPRRCALMSVQYVEALRMNTQDLKTPMRVAMMIEDHIGDLLNIPPYVAGELPEAIAEVTITEKTSGRKIREVVLRDED